MLPREFAAMNCVYRDDELFSGTDRVPGYRDDETETSTTVWQPNADDLAKLNAGAAIVVICDGEQAPIFLDTLKGVN